MLIFFAIIIFLFSSIALISSTLALTATDRILYGVTVQDIPLGGLTKTEAEAKLANFYQNKLENHTLLLLRSKQRYWEIKAANIDFQINTALAAEKAYNVGRQGNIFKRLWEHIECINHGIKFASEAQYDENKLQSFLTQIAKEISTETQNAYCSYEKGKVVIHPEITGMQLDTTELPAIIHSKLMSIDLPTAITLPITETQPTITTENLKNIDTKLAVYTSTFNAHNINRSENIKIAATSINNLLIQPQQIVSFNDLVGLRIAAAGFKEAPVIIDGKTVPDIGGGVCQVSSTLYNAILLADLKPIERSPHFHPLGYVPIGLDATVADNLLDFKFQNTLPNPIYLITDIADNQLVISVLGNANDSNDTEIILDSTIDKTLPYKQKIEYDNTLASGHSKIKEDGITGYIVSSYRVKKRQGKEISRELLYIDEYSPEDEIKIVGTQSNGKSISHWEK